MKRFIPIAIILLIGLSGCVVIASQINPIIGTWKATPIAGTVTTYVFGTDGTCSENTTVLSVIGVSKNGTWTNTSTTISRHWSDSTGDTLTYAFNSDHSQMTVLPSGGGISLTFTRQ